ncbi:MAG: hypothetical protein CL678_06420 [Bdellovibrionaceae bacterium]|nr:hypothetical protein [Pseudobdellovibrionaceae bacterium]|tara:strand:- start:110 stop:544 length:435 start_codon:yes stop_codon:yes gene_type:complete
MITLAHVLAIELRSIGNLIDSYPELTNWDWEPKVFSPRPLKGTPIESFDAYLHLEEQIESNQWKETTEWLIWNAPWYRIWAESPTPLNTALLWEEVEQLWSEFESYIDSLTFPVANFKSQWENQKNQALNQLKNQAGIPVFRLV